MNKKLKLVLGILGIILIAGLAVLVLYLDHVKDYKDKVAGITIEEINLAEIPDGSYIGEYDVDFIYAKVEVTVQSGLITDINLLEHKNGKGAPAEIIIDEIIEQQSLEVDAVSGATNSSKVIKKAIENALINGGK